ncbi:MAG: SusC/RagA family TonB-linked outer membrane protein [Bacteroidales bacterium]
MKKVFFTTLVMLFFSVLSSELLAQEKTLTGKVLAADTGEPIPIASVLVKGYNTLGTYTLDDGTFIIKNVPANATHLIFNSMGYVTVEIPIGTQKVFNVKLNPDAISLNDVVVTALGIQRQAKEIGYATAKVSSDDLTKTKNMDATQALIGKVSGLQISTASASLDAEVRVNLRGSRSFKGDNQALLVVDGVPTPINYLQTMNPNDIENISVLKGGSAAALYGSAAANGVLYVTTKKGEVGRPRVTYSLTTTFDKMSYFPKYQKRFGGGAENGTTGFGYYIADENQQYGPEFDGSIVDIGQPILLPDNITEKQLTGTYDFKDGAREGYYQTGIGLQNDISFSSGGENGNFFMSYQHAHRTGTITGDEYRRQTIRFNASRTYKKIRVGGNLSYSNTKTDMNNSSSNGMQSLWNTPGNIDLPAYKDWRNVEGANPNDWINSYYLNPYAQVDLYRREARMDRITASADLEYKPLPWLKFQGRAGLNLGISNKNNKQNAWHYSDFAKNTRSYASSGDVYTALTTSSNYSNRVNIDAMAFAEHKFNDKFQIKGMLGWSMNDNYSEYKSVGASSMGLDGLFNVSNRISELEGDNRYTQSRQQSIYGSIDFSAFGWAYLQVTGRNDWTSLLAPKNWSFFYPGANLSVMLSDALPAIKHNKWLSYLKLRGTYAKVGSVNIGTYNLDDIANVHSSFPFGSLTGYYIGQDIRNRDIKPEFTTEFEVGVELGLLKDRVILEAAYYHQKTTDQTVNVDIPQSTGAYSKYLNAGVMTGQGVELDLKVTPLIRIGDFSWNINANATFSKTNVSELYGDLTELAIESPIFAILGQNYPMIKASDYKRDPQGRVIVNPTTGLPSVGDMVQIGTTEPKIRIGLSTVMRWRGFSLAATFDYRGGHYTSFGQETMMLFTGSSYTSAMMGRQRFVFPNSVIAVKDASGNVSYEENKNITVNSGNKSFWASNYYSCISSRVVSAAAWKLRELSISYDLPEKLLDKTKFFQRISVGFVGRNLFMWVPSTNLWGDPENWSGTGVSNAPGVAANAQSGSRTFGFNVTLSF